jgi:hypothetical protein
VVKIQKGLSSYGHCLNTLINNLKYKKYLKLFFHTYVFSNSLAANIREYFSTILHTLQMHSKNETKYYDTNLML